MVEWEVESKHIVTSNYSFVSSVHTHTVLHLPCKRNHRLPGRWLGTCHGRKTVRLRRLWWRCCVRLIWHPCSTSPRAQSLYHSDHHGHRGSLFRFPPQPYLLKHHCCCVLVRPARAGHIPEWHPQRTDSAHALNSRTSNRFTGFCVPIQANKEPVGDSNSSYKCAR